MYEQNDDEGFEIRGKSTRNRNREKERQETNKLTTVHDFCDIFFLDSLVIFFL